MGINPRSDSYESLLWDVVCNVHRYIPKPLHRVLDLGAHFGMFSLYCASRGCYVKAYEPNPEVFSELMHTAEVAKEIGLGRINPVRMAIWSAKGVGCVRKRSESSAANVVIPSEVSDPQQGQVACVCLREAMEGKYWHCVKVDVEGAEAEIFSSVEDEDFQRIGFLTIEIHNDLIPRYVRTMLQGKLKAHFPNWEEVPVKVNGAPTDDTASLFCWR